MRMRKINYDEIDMSNYANIHCQDGNISIFFANVRIDSIDDLINALEKLKSKLK